MFIFDNDSPFWLDVLYFFASWIALSFFCVGIFIAIGWATRAWSNRRKSPIYHEEQLYLDFDRAEEEAAFFKEIEELRNDFDN